MRIKIIKSRWLLGGRGAVGGLEGAWGAGGVVPCALLNLAIVLNLADFLSN